MRIRAASIVLGLVALTSVALPASAADPADPTRDPVTAHDPAGPYPAPTLHGELQLSLGDAIAMGLENNLNVEIQRHAPLIAYEDYRMAWGVYDPEWFSEFGYARIENPTGNVLAGTDVTTTETLDGFGGFRGLIPWLGASYELELVGSDVRTDFSIQDLSPELNSQVNFAFTIPLLRDLIWNEPWTLVKTTRLLETAAQDDFRRNLMNTVRDIEDTYWALIASDERVGVSEKSLETAQALLDQVRVQYEVGVVSKVEIAQAESGVAAREFELIVSKNRYQTTMDELIDLVLGPNLTADSRIQIEPSDRPDDYVTYEVDVEEAARMAFRNRPELAVAEREIERLELNVKFAKNQRLPRLDAVVSYGNRGIAGEASPQCGTVFPTACDDLGGFDKTFDHYFTDRGAEQFVARGILSIPIPNTVGRHSVSKAELDLRRAHVQRRRVEQNIILEIRKAARDLESAQEGIEAAERQVVAAAEQLRAERIRLEYGESTPFDVLLKEEDFVDAEARKITAFQTYRSSVTGLDRSQGTILRNRNISIDQASRLR
jgi:outer membrane protein TolC